MHVWKPSAELIILIFGIIGVLTALEHIDAVLSKKRVVMFLFVLGIFMQLLAHSLQFYYATTNAREAERDANASTAIALYAFTADDIPLLKATSSASYLVGYRLFKDGRLEESVPFFRQALFEKKFVASSYFLLAQIDSHDHLGRLVSNSPDKDWDEAERFLNLAIKDDPEYAPAYYLLASLYANSNRIALSLKNLPHAVLPLRFGRVGCQNINRPEIVERDWKPDFIIFKNSANVSTGSDRLSQFRHWLTRWAAVKTPSKKVPAEHLGTFGK
jgi:tetratricopeptide (TPR) repeat protein